MNKKACIYCGTTTDLSESDIIPDALTNHRITNKNVCRKLHNNKFSDLFESNVINSLLYITNKLNIKTSKKGHYTKFKQEIEIDGKTYTASFSSDIELFTNHRIISSKDGKSKIGFIDDLKNINTSNGIITPLDLTQTPILKNITKDIDVFFSTSMYRMIGKIAYEWYCKINHVVGKNDCFDELINFILTGNSPNPVSLVYDPQFYELFDNYFDYGSHTLISYIDNKGYVNVIVSLFGIAIYSVRVLAQANNLFTCNYNFQLIKIDGKSSSFSYNTYYDLKRDFFISDKNNSTISQRFICSEIIRFITEHGLDTADSNKVSAINLINTQIDRILFFNALTLRNLKRFANNYKEPINTCSSLSPNISAIEPVFNIYLLFLIGNKNNHVQSYDDVISYVKSRFGMEEYIKIDKKIAEDMLSEMMQTENYLTMIREGINIIGSWN